MLAGHLDGLTSNVQGVAQMMHEDSQRSRSKTLKAHREIQHCHYERKCHPRGMRPRGRTIWEWVLLGSQGIAQARRPPSPPQSTSHVHPVRAAHNSTACTNETVSAYTHVGNSRLQTAVIRCETSRRMQQQAKRVIQKPFLHCTNMQSGQGRVGPRPKNQRHDVPAPGRRISGQNHHIWRHHCCQENRAILGENERCQNQSRGQDVVDRWILLGWWPSGSRSSVQRLKSMEEPPQPPRHWAHCGHSPRAVVDWTLAWCDTRDERNIANTWSVDSGSLQWLCSRYSTSDLPRPRPGLTISEADESESTGALCPRHLDQDTRGPSTLRHPRKRTWGGPSGKPGPRRHWRHGDWAAIHLRLELS